MPERFLELDRVSEGSLPEYARDGKSGDRASMLEAGLLHVEEGVATFARWSDVLAMRIHSGHLYVLVPRRSPSPPWIRLSPALFGESGPEVLKSIQSRLESRLMGGGYRDAVRRQRQDLDTDELLWRVKNREQIPGVLEVPSTIKLGGSYPWMRAGQLAVFAAGSAFGYALMFGGFFVGAMLNDEIGTMFALFSYFAIFAGVLLGAFAASQLAKHWRARVDAGRPRQRVLVLAPDGCVVGFRTGVRALAWSRVGEFTSGPTQPDYEHGLIVRGLRGETLGDISAGWLDAPLELVVSIAETYREAAR